MIFDLSRHLLIQEAIFESKQKIRLLSIAQSGFGKHDLADLLKRPQESIRKTLEKTFYGG
jgi:hypothetical protein